MCKVPDYAHLFIATDLDAQPVVLAGVRAFLITECAKHNISIYELTHSLDPHNLYEAALAARSCLALLPPHSILIVYVRGSGRQARNIVVQKVKENCLMILPDNGLISLIWNNSIPEGVEIYPLSLSNILPLREYLNFVMAPHGHTPLRGVKPLALYMPKAIIDAENGRVQGQVIAIDRLGNIVFNITAEDISTLKTPVSTLQMSLFSGFKLSLPLCKHGYFDAEGVGSPLLYFNDLGYLEFSVFGGNAASVYGLCVGDEVVFSVARERLL